jgi:hypothetical protein
MTARGTGEEYRVAMHVILIRKKKSEALETMSEIIHWYHGKPDTRQTVDREGNLTLSVTPRELTPLRAKAADALAVLNAYGILYLGFHFTNAHMPQNWVLGFMALSIVAALSMFPLVLFWRFLLKKKTRMVMTADRFSAQTWRGWKNFDRTLPHKFAVIAHDKAQAEQEQHDLKIREAQARGRIISKTRYYGQSFHIVFEYVGQRHDVLTVFGQKQALAVAARLKACDGVLDRKARMGEGVALDPDDQWDRGPGDIDL